jgi:WD40 repeat protein
MQLKKKWTFKYGESILGVKLSALTKKQTKKLFVSTKSGKILVFDLNGKLVNEEEIAEDSPFWNLEICDVNNDGIEELILGGMDGLLRVFRISSQSTLEPLWAHRFSSSVSGFRIGDIDNDERFEIIAYSLDKSLRTLNSNDGSLIWGQIFEDGIEDAKIWTDINEFNRKEVLACGNDGTIRLFEASKGELLWFKRFSDKIRFIDYINSKKGVFILCGGDDKQLHFIDKESQEEIKTIEFDNYIWKCLSFPTSLNTSLLVSSYSFDYMEKSEPIQEMNFSSKLLCIDSNLEIAWELLNTNVEASCFFQIQGQKVIIIGTTKGEILLLDEKNGTLKFNINQKSIINSMQYEPITNLLITCNDDGQIFAYELC